MTGTPSIPESFVDEMRAAGHAVSEWSNGPGYRYAPHAHPYKKILCCLDGSIVFHFGDRAVSLRTGEQVVVEPGVEHSAVVGPGGVRCAEAYVG